jgi:hypothetical protein
MNTPVYEFAMVHRSLEHIEIVNITKNPLDAKVYTCLDVVRPEAPNLKIFSNNDCLDQVKVMYETLHP